MLTSSRSPFGQKLEEQNATEATQLHVQTSSSVASVEKVVHLDVLVGTMLSFVDVQTLAVACQVCVVWNVTGSMKMFWYPPLLQRWGNLLSLSKNKEKATPKTVFRQCLHSEQNVMREHVNYHSTRTLMDSKDTPLCMQFDGDMLISGHIDKNIHIFDLKSGAEVRKWKGHTSWVKCLQFDEHVLITGSYDSTIKEWSRHSNYDLVQEYVGHGENGVNLERSPRGSVVCLQFDKEHVVSGSNDTTVRVWSRETGKCKQVISGHDRTVRCLEFRHHTCFSGGSDRCIKVFDLNTGQTMNEFAGHGHRVSCLQIHRMNSNLVISGSNDRTARIWDSRIGSNSIATVAEHDEAIRRLQFDDVKLITGGDDQVLRCWDMRKMTSNGGTPHAAWEHATAVGPSRGGPSRTPRPLASSANDGRIFSRPLSRFMSNDPSHHGRVSALQFDATRLVCAFTLGQTTDGTHQRRGSIKMWDFEQCVPNESENDTESDETSHHK